MNDSLSRGMDKITTWSGSPRTFVGFWVIVLCWLVVGKPLGFTDGWQLLINTPTTIVTTALGFAILHVSNRDTKALHAKLDGIMKKIDDASADPDFQRLFGVEKQSEEVVTEVQREVDAT